MSRRELADAVNTLLWEKEGIKEHLGQDDIGKIENGRVRWPREARRLGFRVVLRARTDADLGFYFYREAAGPAVGPSSPEGYAGWVTAAPDAGAPRVGRPPRPQAHANNSDLPTANLGKLLGHSAAEALEFAPRTGASCLDPRTIEHLHPLCLPRLLCSQATASVLPLLVAGGRILTGSVINARILPAADDGRIVAALPQGGADSWAPGWPGRELLVGVVERGTHVDAFGIDSRRAGLQVATAEARLPIPRAYQLDDLTVGLLWAVTNLETSLLGDDAQLAACHGWISQYESLPHSSASRDAVASLSQISQMWLGSEFCARHILRHCDTLAGLPAFWTREQHGEEASTWLLFTHKYDYLKHLADRYRSRAEPMTRTFSITETAITTSPPRERVLLLLAVALMESFGIQVNLCLDPAYRQLEGFVLDRQRCAIIANWVDIDAVWHVDVNTNKPDLQRYADALDHAQARSAIAAKTPTGRLTALAGLLDLDWEWLTHRCGELAAYGSAGIAEPHSRLLSTAGVDRACGYVATVATHNG